MLRRKYFAAIVICGTLLIPIVSSQDAYAGNVGGVPTSGATATTSALTCGPNGCSAAVQATFKGNSSSNSGNQNTKLPKNGNPGSHGSITYAPPPAGCVAFWFSAPGSSSAILSATCKGTGES